MDNKTFLEHFGILGMHWGRRSGPSTVSKTKAEKHAEKKAKEREKILASPTKLYKHRDKFSQEEITKAMAKMEMDKKLRSLSRDELESGAKFANTILAYGTAAGTAYTIYKSPLGQALISKLKK